MGRGARGDVLELSRGAGPLAFERALCGDAGWVLFWHCTIAISVFLKRIVHVSYATNPITLFKI
jgi:hypothetical protein